MQIKTLHSDRQYDGIAKQKGTFCKRAAEAQPPASGKPKRVRYTKTIKPRKTKVRNSFCPSQFPHFHREALFRFGSRVPGHAPNYRR